MGENKQEKIDWSGVPSELDASDTPPNSWEYVAGGECGGRYTNSGHIRTHTTRMRVEGGWLYRTVEQAYLHESVSVAVAQTFVPES
jgi:hypothetical protein